jgi:hypothetical protein
MRGSSNSRSLTLINNRLMALILTQSCHVNHQRTLLSTTLQGLRSLYPQGSQVLIIMNLRKELFLEMLFHWITLLRELITILLWRGLWLRGTGQVIIRVTTRLWVMSIRKTRILHKDFTNLNRRNILIKSFINLNPNSKTFCMRRSHVQTQQGLKLSNQMHNSNWSKW